MESTDNPIHSALKETGSPAALENASTPSSPTRKPYFTGSAADVVSKASKEDTTVDGIFSPTTLSNRTDVTVTAHTTNTEPTSSLIDNSNSFNTPAKYEEDNSFSQNSPLVPVKSPSKSPVPRVSLPRVVSGSLSIMKRRRLEPSTPKISASASEDGKYPLLNSHITPSKSRSVSSPVYPGLINQKRTPSLQDRPIPVLSPPSPSNLSRSTSSSFVSPYSLLQTPTGSQCIDDLASLPGSASSNSSDDISTSSPSNITLRKSRQVTDENRNPEKSSASYPIPQPVKLTTSPSITLKPFKSQHRISPLASKLRDPKLAELSKIDLDLDRELMKWRKLADIARQAQKYQAANEDEKLADLAEKWQDVAQKGASYLFNNARARIERMGGMEEYIRRQKEDEESRQQIGFGEDDSFDVDELSPEDRERYDILKAEYEDEIRRTKPNDEEEDPKEFTMQYMLKSLNIDYDMIFPDGFDTEYEF